MDEARGQGPGAKGEHRFGFVSCLGRTNVGKSTLMNRLLGQKVGIVSPKPQTTRRRLRGILNLPEAQIVLVDTPGLHGLSSPVSRSLEKAAREGVEGSDLVLSITDHLCLKRREEEERVLEIVRRYPGPAIQVINKCDLIDPPLLGEMLDHYGDLKIFRGVIAVSAKRGDHLPEVVRKVAALMPPGPAVYPRDIISDQPEREFFAEILREKIFHHVHQELPYAAAVVIEEVTEEEGRDLYRIRATIHVERESQKGMLIGGGGQVLRRIGTAARLDMEKLTGSRVYLSLWVKVRKNWGKDPRSLKEFGFE
jgi:GTP-binding protein Era